MKKNGFTLVELLVVIVIVSILATLVVTGVRYAMRVARAKRVSQTCAVLKTAIVRFHNEYNKWPGGQKPKKDDDKGYVATYSGADNANVFGPLRADSKDNPDGIDFLDETGLFAPDGDAGAVKLSDTKGNQPLVYPARSGRWPKKSGSYLYYKVEINFEFDKVEVTAPEFEDDDD